MIYLIILVSFFIRAFPRLRLKNALVSDTYFHLYCAQTIRENSFRLPRKLPRIVLNHIYTYPFLYHYLLACFPLKYRLWAERLTGAFFDTFSLIMIYLFSGWAVRRMGGGYPLTVLPIWVAALYAFSPALLRIGLGPRAYNGSPRVLGQSLYLLHLFAAYYAYANHNMAAVAISMLAGAAVIITAKFGTQVLFFFGLFFSVVMDWRYPLLLIGSLILSVLLTKGRSLDVLEGHTRHSIFYFKYLQKVYLYPSHPTLMQYLKRAFHGLCHLVQCKWMAALNWYYTESFFIHFLVTVTPQFLFLPAIWQKAGGSSIESFLFMWAGMGLFWFFLTKTKNLLFLGEGERYLEYALFPSIFLVVQHLLSGSKTFFLYAWLGYSIISAVFYLRLYLKETPSNFEETEKLFSKLNGLSEGVILPIGPFHWQALYRSKFPVLTYGANMDERMMSLGEFKLVYGNFPYSPNFHQVLDRYHIAYILTDRTCLDHYVKNVMKNPIDFYNTTDKLFETKTLMLRRVRGIQGSMATHV
jgi:hypothetical protein